MIRALGPEQALVLSRVPMAVPAVTSVVTSLVVSVAVRPGFLAPLL
ncbi:hypothetical protein [Nonomuraea terrae]|nr:hypothetical protein [Nonomuraea terrae]